MVRYEIHFLANAGRPLVGEWRLLERAVDEAQALRRIEQLRENDRRERGWANSYRVVERAEVTVDQICAELDGFMAELQAKQGAR